MANWRDRLDVAKFRGVSFFVEATEATGGRALAVHRFAFREEPPYTEDTGPEGKTWPLECYVLGDDYIAQRDLLIAALDTAGASDLTHPTYGTRRVAAKSYRVRESKNEGGMARFSVEFIESSSGPAMPTNAPDGATAVGASAPAAQAAVVDEFLGDYDGTSTLRDSIAGALSSASDTVSSIAARVSMAAQTIASLTRTAQSLSASAVELAAQPSSLASAVIEMVQTLASGLIASAVDPTTALLELYSFAPGLRPPSTTPARAIEQSNFDAVSRLVQRVTLTQAALVAIQQTFDSYDDAVSVRSSITDLIDDQAELVADDTYPDLQQMRADLVKAVPGDDSDLPRLLTYTPNATVPSLVLSYRLYGDLDGEADLIARNKVHHPGFIAGREPLEVLSRG